MQSTLGPANIKHHKKTTAMTERKPGSPTPLLYSLDTKPQTGKGPIARYTEQSRTEVQADVTRRSPFYTSEEGG